jgi:hypothetical protein
MASIDDAHIEERAHVDPARVEVREVSGGHQFNIERYDVTHTFRQMMTSNNRAHLKLLI